MTSTLTLTPEQHVTINLTFGGRLRVEAPAGGHPLQLLAVVAGDPRDRFSAANTLAINKSAYLGQDTVLLSYFCLPLLKVVRDDTGKHSLLPSPPSSESDGTTRAARALRLLEDAGKDIGLEPHQVPQAAQFFVRHAITEDGTVAPAIITGEPSAVLDLEAQVDLAIALVSNPFIAPPNDATAARDLLITIEEPTA